MFQRVLFAIMENKYDENLDGDKQGQERDNLR
jgi:hypothetical protein